MMSPDASYSVLTARNFYNRPFFGAKLTSLVTTVTSMQEELEQVLQNHSYLDVHHHQDDIKALACLDSIQDLIKGVAEFVGRTRTLPRDQHGAIIQDIQLPGSILAENKEAENSRGGSPQEDFRDFSWACSEDFTARRTDSAANMESRWSYSTDGSSGTDSSSEYEGAYEIPDEDDEGIYYPAVEYHVEETEEPEPDTDGSFEIATSPDSEVGHVVILSDIGFRLEQDTIARMEAAILEPRLKTKPLPTLRNPSAAEVTNKVPNKRTTIARRITELLHKAKMKVKFTGTGGCRSC
jgi:hypothetical protein